MKKAFSIILTITILSACSNNDKKPAAKQDTIKPVRTNNPEKKKEESTAGKTAIITISDTVSPKRIVLYMKDSAKVFDRISLKLGIIYGVKLGEVLKKNNIKMTGAPMACVPIA